MIYDKEQLSPILIEETCYVCRGSKPPDTRDTDTHFEVLSICAVTRIRHPEQVNVNVGYHLEFEIVQSR